MALSLDPQNFSGRVHGLRSSARCQRALFGPHPRALVLLPIEDALGVEEQANLPGTVDTHPNWRRRLPGDCATVLDLPAVARRLELLACSRLQAQERDQMSNTLAPGLRATQRLQFHAGFTLQDALPAGAVLCSTGHQPSLCIARC
jgi:hypothetical protein